MRMRTHLFAYLFLITVAHTAAADVCVVLDEARDTLSPDDRRAAQISFEQALANNHVQVTSGTCTQTYTFYNVKLGDTITVYVSGPGGQRQARASKIDELPLLYDQLVSSLVTGEPMGSIENVDRTNATTDQMAPRRVVADSLFYLRLGAGWVAGDNFFAVASGLGYRYELDALAIEISVANLVWATRKVTDASGDESTHGGINGDVVAIGALRFQAPTANRSLYYGGRFGYGVNNVYNTDTGASYDGNGLQLTAVLGYEMLRASTIRMFVELDATAPFYGSSGADGSGGMANKWAPIVALTLGAGLGR